MSNKYQNIAATNLVLWNAPLFPIHYNYVIRTYRSHESNDPSNSIAFWRFMYFYRKAFALLLRFLFLIAFSSATNSYSSLLIWVLFCSFMSSYFDSFWWLVSSSYQADCLLPQNPKTPYKWKNRWLIYNQLIYLFNYHTLLISFGQ